MPLTENVIQKAEPADKQYKLTDGEGMYILVSKKGGKWWRLDYRFNGKRKTLSLGTYPKTKLKKARELRGDARKLISNGVDPSLQRRIHKYQGNEDSFEAVAREWHTKHSPNWSDSHSVRILRRLENDLFPWLGTQPIKKITPPELLSVLRKIENRGAIETAHRAHQNCGQIFRYAVATGRAERDPSGDLKGAIPPAKPKHHPSITDPKKIGILLLAIDDYAGSYVTKCAFKLAPLVFVRPGELRHAEWSEFDFDNSEWRIPAEKMKMPSPHIVPLSSQALKVLEDLHSLTGKGKYLFTGLRSSKRPMSENTVNGALRRLGYSKDEMTGHGFRSIASTRLNEMGWNRDAIERQLAHAERDSIRAAYNYAEHLDERSNMMQEWANYLDNLKKPK